HVFLPHQHRQRHPIDAGDGDDLVDLDATLGCAITVRGMAGTDHMNVHGRNLVAAGTYTPNLTAPVGLDTNRSFGGTITAGATVITFSEYDGNPSSITVDGIANFTVNTSNATDNLEILQVAPNQVRVRGTVNGIPGVAMVPLVFTTAAGFLLTVNTNGGND